MSLHEEFQNRLRLCLKWGSEPFREVVEIKDGSVIQVIGVNYAAGEILLRDFAWYDVEEMEQQFRFK